MRFCLQVIFLTLLFACSVFAQTDSAPVGDRPYDGFVGNWTGHLEYRDYSNNQRVLLPTWLTVSTCNNGKSLRFDYVYDDGPHKIVKETTLVTIDPAKSTWTSSGDKSSEIYQVEGLKEFLQKGKGKLLLTGNGTENDKPVSVRITVTLQRNLYQLVKETKPAGDDFQFRDAYVFTRNGPPEPQ